MQLTLLADRPQAAQQVAGWYFETWGRHVPGVTLESELEKVRGYMGRETPLLVLALDDDEVVGCAAFKIREMPQFPDFEHWLGGVFVDPSQRGRGVAGELVLDVLRRARRAGVEQLYLQTEDLTGGLYGRLGFEPLQEVDNRGRRVLVMRFRC